MDSVKRPLIIIPVQTLTPIIPVKVWTIIQVKTLTTNQHDRFISIPHLPSSPRLSYAPIQRHFPSRTLSFSAVDGRRDSQEKGRESSFLSAITSRGGPRGSGRNRGRNCALWSPKVGETGGGGAYPELMTSVSVVGWKRRKSRCAVGSDGDMDITLRIRKGKTARKNNFYYSLQLTPHPLCNTNMRYNFFANRIIKIWNKLPEQLISSKSFEIFKISLHKFNLRIVFTFRY